MKVFFADEGETLQLQGWSYQNGRFYFGNGLPNMTNQILFINLVLRDGERDPETGSGVVRLAGLGSFLRNLGKRQKKKKKKQKTWSLCVMVREESWEMSIDMIISCHLKAQQRNAGSLWYWSQRNEEDAILLSYVSLSLSLSLVLVLKGQLVPKI